MRALAARLPEPLRAAALYAVAIAFAKGISLVLLPVLTATLTPEQFGRLEILASAAEIGGLLAGAGLVDTLYRFASARGDAGRMASGAILCLACIIGFGVASAVAAASPWLAAAMPVPTLPAEIAVLGVAAALEAVIGVPLAWLRMHGRAAAYAAACCARATIHAGLVVWLVLSGHGVLGVLAGGAIAGVVVASALLISQARQSGLRAAPAEWGRFLAYGLPLTAGGLAAFCLGTTDRWFLAGQVSAADIGLYGVAAKFALAAALITQPFEL